MNFFQRLLAVIAVGTVLNFASEMLFWTTPEAGVAPGDIALTWSFYLLTAWAGLSAAARAGVRDVPGLLLAGSIFGWLLEGVIVDTVYSALPYTVPFTAMSWHALISVIAVLVGVRQSAHWRLMRQILFLLGLGVFFGLWGQFWPLERGAMPPDEVTWSYLIGLGLLVPLANHLLDALPARYPYVRGEALILGGLFMLVWAAKLVLSGNPFLLVLPAVILPSLWIMRRIGSRAGYVVLPARPRRPIRHWLFLIVPFVTATLAIGGWHDLGGVETNWPLAIVMTGVALWLYARAVFRVFRRTKGDHTGAQ